MQKLKGKNIKKRLGIIELLQVISEKAEKSKLPPEALIKKIPEVEFLAIELFMMPIQALLFGIIFSLNFSKKSADLSSMAEFLGVKAIALLDSYNELLELEQERLIKREIPFGINRNGNSADNGFVIPEKVFENIINDRNPAYEDIGPIELPEFIELSMDLFKSLAQYKIDEAELNEEIFILFYRASKLPFVQSVKKMGLEQTELNFFLYVCANAFDGENETDLNEACTHITHDMHVRFNLRKAIVRNQLNITHQGLIGFENSMFRNDKVIFLTDKGLELLLGNDADLMINVKQKNNLIYASDITERNMFYNTDEEKSVKMLYDLLAEKGYCKVQKKMKAKGMRTGVTVLLYGPPGTGKTETVMQIARITGRPLVNVDISTTKSMWFGESEKKIKAVFDDYKTASRASTIVPILLFNEADGVLSKRGNVSHSTVSQTQNAIQNIILQEMENLEGIMIATTNLTFNLDDAFERRFLFKLKLSSPDTKVRKQIWNIMLPGLKPQWYEELAELFPLSGGQIENISRKFIATELIYSKKPSLPELRDLCSQEVYSFRKSSNSIGFKSK